jgi:hypothetical protein
MNAPFVNVGLHQALQYLGVTELNNATLMLFTNPITPTPTTVLGDLAELVGTGYVRPVLTGWGAPVLGGDGYYTTSLPVQNFTNSGGTNWPAAYGWAYVNFDGITLISVGLFTSPIVNPPSGILPLTPIFGLGSEY